MMDASQTRSESLQLHIAFTTNSRGLRLPVSSVRASNVRANSGPS
ncbi:hypothetical protein QE320_gp095 [Pseudomonas phage EM]|uniref:Uncharacterized protein n=1 Tax=Pseudomonas phage EM TaxID=2936914 RepID=A0AAE9KT28_9CAUD|nr:hypothetical protein QE320_gp095 [Pseudomonas phage EM]UPW35959.1 hypothetical protein EM_174 [Pseudomonas phage EM]